MRPTPTDLAAFVGRKAPDEGWQAQAQSVLDMVGHMVRRYVRGNGFTGMDPDDDLAAVIVSASARLIANPDLTRAETIGPAQISYGTFDGWTLPELAILHTYRRRTA